MDEILNELDSAFRTLSTIPVTGDAVDAMAVTRAKLRKVYAELVELNKKSQEEET